jgi:hypothetical protein
MDANVTVKKVVDIQLSVSPKELATMYAALAVTSVADRMEATDVSRSQMLVGSEDMDMYLKLQSAFEKLKGEGAF